MDVESMFPFLLRSFRKQIYRSLASGLCNSHSKKSLSLQVLQFAISCSMLLLRILAGADNVVVFMEACQENTCFSLNKDENG
jgi:hypothetical protein